MFRGNSFVVTACALLLPMAHRAVGQSSPGQIVIANDKVPQYDVVTVKPNKTGSGGSGIDIDDGNMKVDNYSIRGLVSEAYDVKRDQVLELPAWANGPRYDLVAKVLEPDMKVLDNLSRTQRRSMLRPVLADRFALKCHAENRTLPIYEAVLAKGSPKFAEASKADKFNGVGDGGTSVHNTHLTAHGVTLDNVLEHLSNELHRPIVNKTGLSGKYDFDLAWSRDDMAATPGTDTSSTAPSLFTALEEQLGLKLVSTKGPVEVVVVDSVSPPTEN